MKLSNLSLSALFASCIIARFVESNEGQIVLNLALEEPNFLIDIAGEQRWVTEEEKWDIKRGGEYFMDITNYRALGSINGAKAFTSSTRLPYPSKVSHKSTVLPIQKRLNKTNIQTHLEHFVTFHNRFWDSTYGAQSCRWLLSIINDIVAETGADKYGVVVKPFIHIWDQFSIIVTIPGKGEGTVVLGAHQDSANYKERYEGRAPGADDDGSGTMTILEVLRVLLSDEKVLQGEAENTIEFHWYSGEEGGLLGSQDVFSHYEKEGRDVKAMLQTDMTGFTQLTREAGRNPQFGLMMDIMDEALMNFTKLVIEEYTDLEWVETGCGKFCGSDHMSAIKAGYPGVCVTESEFKHCAVEHLHGPDDLIKYLDFDHMVDHAKYILGFAYELAFAKL
ncbi:leucine aminopeptidase 1 [Bisporella sp. PMI_857]|nr:leucine aminopeptidase 1 [Bisporella sp. PMI_857]